MQHTPLPQIPLLFTICALLLTAGVLGQSKSGGDVVVTKCWSYPTGETSGKVLASDTSHVFLGFGLAKVEALSFDGKKMWSSELGGDINSNFLALDSALMVVTSTVSTDPETHGGSVLRNLSKQTGITNWTLKLPDAENHFLVGFKDSIVVVSKSGVIQSIKSESGVVNWKRQIAESFAAKPAITGVKLHVAATGRQVFTISMETGEIESLRRVPFNVTSLGGVQTGELIVGDERGNLSSLSNAGDKANWKFKSGGEVSQIFPVGEHLLVTSHDNFIYFLGRGNGGLVWKKRLTGRVSQIANLMDRFALISSVEDHTAVFIDLANGKVAGQIAFGEDEKLGYSPVSSSDLIFVQTDEAAYGFSLAGCSQNKESGPDTKPATAILK